MSLEPKKYPRAAVGVIGGIILLSCIAVAGAQAEDGGAQPPHARLAAGLRASSLNFGLHCAAAGQWPDRGRHGDL